MTELGGVAVVEVLVEVSLRLEVLVAGGALPLVVAVLLLQRLLLVKQPVACSERTIRTKITLEFPKELICAGASRYTASRYDVKSFFASREEEREQDADSTASGMNWEGGEPAWPSSHASPGGGARSASESTAHAAKTVKTWPLVMTFES